jgi:hypothetical protein
LPYWLIPTIDAHIATFAHPPASVATDQGFASAIVLFYVALYET